MKIFLLILFHFVTLSVFAQQEIKIEDASKHIGDSVRICSKIFGGKYLETAKGSPTFLNFGGAYPNAPVTIVIWENVRKEFKKIPEEYYVGKIVCVTGRVELFKDKPEIVLRGENQIQEQSSNH